MQKGSLIQTLLFDETVEKYEYLLAKVEHTEWVDDSDFAFKTGFSKDKKTIWKSCLFDLSDLTATEFYAKVYLRNFARFFKKYWFSGEFENGFPTEFPTSQNLVKRHSFSEKNLIPVFSSLLGYQSRS